MQATKLDIHLLKPDIILNIKLNRNKAQELCLEHRNTELLLRVWIQVSTSYPKAQTNGGNTSFTKSINTG